MLIIFWTFLYQSLILFWSFKEPFSGILIKISDCRQFSPFKTEQGNLIRGVVSSTERCCSMHKLSLLKKQIKVWNRFTFLIKHLIFLRSLKEGFGGNSVKISDCGPFSQIETVPGCRAFSRSELFMPAQPLTMGPAQRSKLNWLSLLRVLMAKYFHSWQTVRKNETPRFREHNVEDKTYDARQISASFAF